MEYSEILYDVTDSIATVTLHRPERMNAFTGTMMHEVIDAFDRIDTANKAARVALQCRAAGHRVGGLGPSELAELERIFDLDS